MMDDRVERALLPILRAANMTLIRAFMRLPGWYGEHRLVPVREAPNGCICCYCAKTQDVEPNDYEIRCFGCCRRHANELGIPSDREIMVSMRRMAMKISILFEDIPKAIDEAIDDNRKWICVWCNKPANMYEVSVGGLSVAVWPECGRPHSKDHRHAVTYAIIVDVLDRLFELWQYLPIDILRIIYRLTLQRVNFQLTSASTVSIMEDS